MQVAIFGRKKAGVEKIKQVIDTAMDNVTVQTYASLTDFVTVTKSRTVKVHRMLFLPDAVGDEDSDELLLDFAQYIHKYYSQVGFVSISKTDDMTRRLQIAFYGPNMVHLNTGGKLSTNDLTAYIKDSIDVLRNKYKSKIPDLRPTNDEGFGADTEEQMISVLPVPAQQVSSAVTAKKGKKQKKGLFALFAGKKGKKGEVGQEDQREQQEVESVQEGVPDQEVSNEDSGKELDTPSSHPQEPVWKPEDSISVDLDTRSSVFEEDRVITKLGDLSVNEEGNTEQEEVAEQPSDDADDYGNTNPESDRISAEELAEINAMVKDLADRGVFDQKEPEPQMQAPPQVVYVSAPPQGVAPASVPPAGVPAASVPVVPTSAPVAPIAPASVPVVPAEPVSPVGSGYEPVVSVPPQGVVSPSLMGLPEREDEEGDEVMFGSFDQVEEPESGGAQTGSVLPSNVPFHVFTSPTRTRPLPGVPPVVQVQVVPVLPADRGVSISAELREPKPGNQSALPDPVQPTKDRTPSTRLPSKGLPITDSVYAQKVREVEYEEAVEESGMFNEPTPDFKGHLPEQSTTGTSPFTVISSGKDVSSDVYDSITQGKHVEPVTIQQENASTDYRVDEPASKGVSSIFEGSADEDQWGDWDREDNERDVRVPHAFQDKGVARSSVDPSLIEGYEGDGMVHEPSLGADLNPSLLPLPVERGAATGGVTSPRSFEPLSYSVEGKEIKTDDSWYDSDDSDLYGGDVQEPTGRFTTGVVQEPIHEDESLDHRSSASVRNPVNMPSNLPRVRTMPIPSGVRRPVMPASESVEQEEVRDVSKYEVAGVPVAPPVAPVTPDASVPPVVEERNPDREHSARKGLAGSTRFTQRKKGGSHSTQFVVVTGDRKTGITTTAFNLAAKFSMDKKNRVLFVDFDLKTHGSLLFVGLTEIAQEDDRVQNGLYRLTKADHLRTSVYTYIEKSTMFDCLLSTYGSEIVITALDLVQKVLLTQTYYTTVVIDCPFEYLSLLQDIVPYAELLICTGSDFKDVLNTVLELDRVTNTEDLVDVRFPSYVYTNSSYTISEGSIPQDFVTNLAQISDYFGLSEGDYDWSLLPIVGGIGALKDSLASR